MSRYRPSEMLQGWQDTTEEVVWQHPSRAIRIELRHGLGPMLAEQALTAFKTTESEVGGLLYGRVRSHNGETSVFITGAEFVPIKERFFNLNPPSQAALKTAWDNSQAAGNTPLGYFRTDIRDSIALTPQDQHFIRNSLPVPNSVSLLIRPFQMGICMVGIFLWENNQLQGDYTDFAVPLFPSDVETPSEQPPFLTELRSPNPSTLESAQHLSSALEHFKRNTLPPITTSRSIAAAAQRSPVPESQWPPQPELTTPSHLFQKVQIGAALCLAIAVLTAFLYSRSEQPKPLHDNTAQETTHAPIPALLPSASTRDLGLQVSRPAVGQINVTWDRQLPANIEGGQMEILDGFIHRTLLLDPVQLRRGKLTYFSTSPDISFRLDVDVLDGPTLSDYIRVLGAKASHVQTAALPPPAGMGKTAEPVITPSAQQTSRLPESGNLATTQTVLEQPITTLPAGADNPLPDSLLTTTATPPELVSPPQSSAAHMLSHTPATHSLKPLGLIQEPKPLQQVMPNTHGIFPSGVTAPKRVAVDITVDAKGYVTDARTKEKPGLLVNACLTAAKQWRFSPGLLNHQPVPRDYHIVFSFNPAKR